MGKRGERKKSRRGQINISFGMIFSIILVVVFLAFAFYGIKTFLSITDNAKVGKFFTDFQSDITSKWGSAFTSQSFEYTIPSYVSLVCIVNFDSSPRGSNAGIYTVLKTEYTGKENLVFFPVKSTGYDSTAIDHLNMSAIVSQENPYCINATNGQVSILLKKDYGENLVTAERTS